MEKRAFHYRSAKTAGVWIVVVGIIPVWLLPNLLSIWMGVTYFLVNGIVVIALVFFLWRYINVLPGVSRTGYYQKENGVTRLEYGKRSVRLDRVTELYLSDRRLFSGGIDLVICNGGKKIGFLSAPLAQNEGIEDSELFAIFTQVLAENQTLAQEKDLHGDPIENWYKA